MFEKFLPGLMSDDFFTIEETIDEMSTIYNDSPTGEIREMIINYCRHVDPGIRRVALRTSAMHWSFPEAFQVLEEMILSTEEDDEVLDVACASIGCYKGNHYISEKKINDLFVAALESDRLSLEYKKEVYLGFLKYYELIDPRVYLKTALSNDVAVDMDLVYRIVNN